MARSILKKESQHIQAFARLRPFNKIELECHAKQCLEISGKDIIVQLPHGSKRFMFDKVFDTNSKQKDVYFTIIAPIIEEVMKGYNCTVFAYGQTGTGKTYTMVGNQTSTSISYTQHSDAGIIPRTLGHLFETLKSNSDMDFTVRVSYLEMYNEIIIDLLSTEEKILKIYEDQKHKGSVQIHGLEEVTVFDKNQVFEILQAGSEKRKTAATLMNTQSSRSHTVFTITLHSRETTPDGEELVKTGKLNLVDLAGSENILKSGAVEKRAREAGNINQSLLTLGRVIKALVEKSPHIPYRESKLTRILQDSLGGKTKTTIIATVSPASNNIEETISTLDYAFRARNIYNRPEVNQKMSKTALVNKYLAEIDSLKKDLHAARSSEGIYLNPENYYSFLEESEKTKQELLKTVEECSIFESRVQDIEKTKTDLEELYNLTKKDLQVSAYSLSKSKDNLKKLRKQRRIHQILIDKYDEAQTNLMKDRSALATTLQNCLKDSQLLHDKVENLYGVIGSNTSSSQTWRESYDKHHTKFMSNVKKYHTNLGHKFGDLNALMTAYNEFFEKTLLQLCEEVHRDMHESSDAIKKSSEITKHSYDSLVKRVVERNAHIVEVLDNIRDSHVDYVSTSKEHVLDMDSRIKDFNTTLTECLTDKALATIAQDESEMENSMEDMKRTISELKKANDNHIAEIEECHKYMLVGMQKIKSAEENAQKNALYIQSVEKKALKVAKCTDKAIDNMKSFCTKTHEIATPIFKSLDENSEKHYVHIEELLGYTMESLSNVQTETNDICEFEKNVAELNKEYSEKMASESHKLKKTGESVKAHCEGWKTDVKGQAMEFEKRNDEVIADIKDMHSCITESLQQSKELVANYFKQLVDAKPTGDTPLRKETDVKYQTPKRVSKNIMEKFSTEFEDSIIEVDDSDIEVESLLATPVRENGDSSAQSADKRKSFSPNVDSASP
ncbi:PREDICTED: kinesin-like protein KIF11-B [Nicrophorus vespilloides]|uniref:Kinesin-like protein n=1 Tax=Nicrophorus vespilloides TaxID=110193 RepID=A0ABM1M399_NICVS|nr:PREDICTED: kinesin-like protein KIF11-B [Nicrophorus vespilloides]XP_017769050.1 PREDICTED: kinesin-like protein KIF11-B [Nicrophorus vespilloides]